MGISLAASRIALVRASGEITMQLNSLQEALVIELKDLLSVEQQLTEALPMMAEKASNPELKQGFAMHLEQTRDHISRLEQAFSLLGEKPEAQTCKAMKGLVAEGQELMNEEAAPNVMDALLIAAAQKIEHYEIASYGTVCTWAKQMGHSDIKDLLGQTLTEEEETDKKLTAIAEQAVNVSAA